MHQHLHKFLVLYKRLSIPHVGSFAVETEAARLDTGSNLLFAPKPVIRFNESNQPLSDKLFFNFLAEEMVVDEMTAIKEFHDFCFTARHNLQENNTVSFGGIGRLAKQPDESLLFTPESNLLEILPPVAWQGNIPAKYKKEKVKEKDIVSIPAETIIEESEETEEVIVAPDKWWIYALVLLGGGIIALLFYYQ